jgi:hypothetical protein
MLAGRTLCRHPLRRDMPTALRNVRCCEKSGKHLLALSFSGFDPQQTSRRRTTLPMSGYLMFNEAGWIIPIKG